MYQAFSAAGFRFLCCLALAAAFAVGHETAAQGSATNYTGNGGTHTIQGRIYTTNGRRSEVSGLKIRLHNVSSNELSLIADGTGAFAFKNLIPGSYTVQVEGGDLFENVQETVVIDGPGSSTLSSSPRLMRGGAARIASVQVFLKPKPGAAAAAAAEVINAKLASVPKPAKELYDAAQVSIKENNDQKAIAQLREALALHKDFALAWNDLGVLLEKTGEAKAAVEAFSAAVRLDPESSGANLNLGCALFAAQAYPEAERYLTEALIRNPTSYRGHYYMGRTQVKLARIDIAEQAFRKAVEVGGPQAGMAHYMLGGIYWSVKRYKDAADELEKYLKLKPDAKDAEMTRRSIAELRNKAN